MYEGDDPRPERVITVDRVLSEECLRERQVEPIGTRPNIPDRKPRWCRPNIGTIKLNCDGAWEPTTGKAGTRVVARDWRGRVVAG